MVSVGRGTPSVGGVGRVYRGVDGSVGGSGPSVSGRPAVVGEGEKKGGKETYLGTSSVVEDASKSLVTAPPRDGTPSRRPGTRSRYWNRTVKESGHLPLLVEPLPSFLLHCPCTVYLLFTSILAPCV